MIFDALFEPRQLSTSNARNPAQWLVDWFNGGSDTAAGIPVSQRSALTYSAVWAATRILSEGVASVPCVLYRRRLQREGKDKARDHILYRVLHDEPNSEMDSCTFFDQQTPFLVNSGNAYAEKERMLSGRIAGLWPLKSHDVNPVRREDGQIEYEVTRDQGGQDIVVAKNMLHVTGVLSEDGIIGKGVITQARESIAMGQATEKYGAGFFGKDCRPGGVLTTDQTLSDKAWGRMKSWSDEHGGFAKAHKLGVLEEGTTYQAIGVNPEDAQFLETRQHNVTELARWYRVPLHMLAIVLGVPRANIEEEGINLVTYSLRPWWVRYERAYHRQLLTEEEKPQLFVGFNGDALLRGDSKSRTESYKNLFGVGGITVNRILGLSDENEIGPDGDRRFVPMNMIPLDRVDDYVDALKAKAERRNSPSKRGPGDGGDQDKPGDVEGNALEWQASEQRLAEKMDAQNIQSGEQHADLMVGIASITQVIQTSAQYLYETNKVGSDLSARRDEKMQRQLDSMSTDLGTTQTMVATFGENLRGMSTDLGTTQTMVATFGENLRGIADEITQANRNQAEALREKEQHAREKRDHQVKAASSVLSEAVGRMLAKEANAAKRAAKEPSKFNAWLDSFYEKHEQTFVDAVGPAVSAWLTALEHVMDPAAAIRSMAADHVATSRRQLLGAAECKPGNLVARVTCCVAGWSGRKYKAAPPNCDEETLIAEGVYPESIKTAEEVQKDERRRRDANRSPPPPVV